MNSFNLPPQIQEFVANLLLALACGLLIGGERELRHKPAGVSTHIHVIGGAMIFTYLSQLVSPGDPARIAAQIVSGVGFLGAGIILKSESTKQVLNLTTAASIWYSAGVGMALGFGYHVIAITAAVYAVLISRIPKIGRYE